MVLRDAQLNLATSNLHYYGDLNRSWWKPRTSLGTAEREWKCQAASDEATDDSAKNYRGEVFKAMAPPIPLNALLPQQERIPVLATVDRDQESSHEIRLFKCDLCPRACQ